MKKRTYTDQDKAKFVEQYRKTFMTRCRKSATPEALRKSFIEDTCGVFDIWKHEHEENIRTQKNITPRYKNKTPLEFAESNIVVLYICFGYKIRKRDIDKVLYVCNLSKTERKKWLKKQVVFEDFEFLYKCYMTWNRYSIYEGSDKETLEEIFGLYKDGKIPNIFEMISEDGGSKVLIDFLKDQYEEYRLKDLIPEFL